MREARKHKSSRDREKAGKRDKKIHVVTRAHITKLRDEGSNPGHVRIFPIDAFVVTSWRQNRQQPIEELARVVESSVHNPT